MMHALNLMMHHRRNNWTQESIPVGCIPPALVATTRCQYCWGVGPQVNKFEQISSNDHQMSLAGVGMPGWREVCPGGGYVQRYSQPCDLFHDAYDVEKNSEWCRTLKMQSGFKVLGKRKVSLLAFWARR